MQNRGFLFLIFITVLAFLSLAIGTPAFRSIPVLKDLYSEPKLGLDIAGGFRFTLFADLSKLTPEEMSLWPEKARLTTRILENRAQQVLGVVEATVIRKGEDRFIVELPGFTDENEARKVVQASARLEFFWAKNIRTEFAAYRPYEIAQQERETGQVMFKRNTGLPDEPLLSIDSEEYKRMLEGWERITTGDTLRKASPGQAGTGRYQLDLAFDAEGARALDAFARKVMNQREYIAAVMDNKVISIAYLKDGVTFATGLATIEGNFTLSEAKLLADLLNAGALPVDLIEESVNRVSPAIGSQALDQIVKAGIVACSIIALFMMVYYVFPGIVAVIALVFYGLFCFAAFAFLGVTFSLAAIAGFILSVGMAVDANILIFERVKEEIRNGRKLLTAIDLGFKRAFPAILDSNACTIITCLVLINFGTGPVKGFATTLMIGVLISLFTAITVTRSLLLILVNKGIGRSEAAFSVNRGWFGERLEARANDNPLKITQRMKLYFVISILVIVPGIIFWGMGGIKPNVEFLGGVESGVRLSKGQPTNPRELNKKLESAGLKGGNVKVATGDFGDGSANIAYVTLPKEASPELNQLLESPDIEDKIKARQMIVKALGGDDSIVEKQTVTGAIERGIADEVAFDEATPVVREETIRGAILGVIIASSLIVIYLAIRFGVTLGGFRFGMRFGMSSVLAMIHDVMVVIGLAAITGYFLNWEISQLTITALLTVIGYSVHDTIVIFDRIRENLKHPIKGETFENLVNRSITQSLARSINTSFTVILVLAVLVFFGSATPDLRHFNLAMLAGILSGTYSSIFNASPILVLWERIVQKRKGEKATIMADERLREIAEEIINPDDEVDDESGKGYAKTKRKY